MDFVYRALILVLKLRYANTTGIDRRLYASHWLGSISSRMAVWID